MFAEERKALEGRFQSEFVAANPSILVAWEGRRFDKPSLETEWVAFLIRSNGEPDQVTLGDNPTVRHFSYIQVNIHVQADKGATRAEQIADLIYEAFKDGNNPAQILVGSNGVINCRIPYRNSLGVREGKYTMILTIPYQYDNLN